MFNEDLIKQARQTNLAEYLMSKGEQLTKNGSRYKHKEHDSLVFTNNAFFWNSRGEKGNAIDFLMTYYGMDFAQAVKELTSTATQAKSYFDVSETDDVKPADETFDINSIKLNNTCSSIVEYLSKNRGISLDIVNALVQRKLIYQERKTRNIVFPMFDELKNIVGAEYHGIVPNKRFKGVAKNSKYGYGFNVAFGTPRHAAFFESAIDLLSFMDIKKQENKELENLILVSMAGLKQNVVSHTIKTYNIEKPPIFNK